MLSDDDGADKAAAQQVLYAGECVCDAQEVLRLAEQQLDNAHRRLQLLKKMLTMNQQ
jgi:hypothetical protein